MADFKAGDKVTYRGMVMPAEVLSGPHRTTGQRLRYLIRKADGNVSLVPVTDLQRVVPRLDKVSGTLSMHIYGRPWSALDTPRRMQIATAAVAAIRIADETRGEA